MIVQIGSGSSGWSEYVLRKNGSTLRPGATLIAGDTDLGDAICKTTNYKSGQYIRMVLSFSPEDKHITPEKGRQIVQEFMRLFMHGYRDDEYHKDIVEHTDTDKLHYHIRIPKLNLITGTQLKIYYDKADRHRKQLIVDMLDDKYGLTRAADRRRSYAEKSKAEEERIQRWRAEHGQQPFNFSKKQGRADAQSQMDAAIEELAAAGLVTSQNDVIGFMEEMGLKIEKIGHDQKKDFDYITASDKTGKMRFKGEIYGEQYWKQHQVENRNDAKQDRERDRSIAKELDRELERRGIYIAQRYQRARERALEARRAAARQRIIVEQMENVRINPPDRRDDRLWRGDSMGVQKSPGISERQRDDDVVVANLDDEERGIDDRVGAEIIDRVRSSRKAREAAIQRVRANLAADRRRVQEIIETSRRKLREEAERNCVEAHKDRTYRAVQAGIRKARENRGRGTIRGLFNKFAETVGGIATISKRNLLSARQFVSNILKKREKQQDQASSPFYIYPQMPHNPGGGGMRMR